ncbi:zinc finger protein 213-like [Pantherophis guttatus]|uniref:Zinc finger protein 213-like n=1 Tax=Pantherophis guttatus TaxID=94885 RepID=A0ABM3YZL3_PANGU|nr:zinc finger protein 213-like [Pantherophis guttatus]
MSEQSRELGETDCWGETVTATQSDACLVRPIGEDEVTLENPEKPRWSIGIGKKDGWDERTRGVTLNRGNRKPGWKLELEALTDQGGLTEAPLREDYLKRHVTRLVMETLENLNIRREPGQQPKSTERAAVMDDARGGTPLLEAAYRADGAAATGEDPANPPPQAARTPVPIPNQPRAPQLEREIPPLGVKFDGNPQQLGFFVAHVLTYMQEYGRDFQTQGSRVRVVTLALEGAAARWMVTLHNANAPELWNFDHFMTALRRRFEDPLADRKARDRIKVVRQGRRPVAEYTEEFWDLACRVHWPEDILVSCFKDGLSDDLYNACVARGAPNDLHEWYVTAEEAEIDMARNQYRAGRAWKKSSPQWKQEPHKPQTAFSPRSSACFKCGKEGHRAAECRSQIPARNHPPGEGPGKPGRRGKETALRSREAIEVPSPPLFGEETLASEQEESHSFGSDPDDEPLEDGGWQRMQERGAAQEEEESGPRRAALTGPGTASPGDSGERPGGSGAAGGMSPGGAQERRLPGGRCEEEEMGGDPEMGLEGGGSFGRPPKPRRIREEAKEHPCPECGKSFKRNHHLQRHLSIHSGKKPHKCLECGKSFRQRENLHSHQRLHLENQYQCWQCEKSFKTIQILEKHVRIHSLEKPFKCLECGKSFHHWSNFDIHERIHSEEKKYECPKCKKSFKRNDHLQRHLIIHSVEKTSQMPGVWKELQSEGTSL